MNTEQHEIYEYARVRIIQKKRLYFHFIVFLLVSLFLFIANKWISNDKTSKWYVWIITAWFFIFILHFIKIFVTDRFMNKKWEREQINKLMALQEKRIDELKKDTENNIK